MGILAVLSMKNRALIALVTIVIAVFGVIALTNLRQELAPDIDFPQLAIVTSYPGASPAVVENDVSTPVEAAIQGIPNLQSTSAVSSTNQSLITAKFTYGSDLATAEQKIDQAINRIKSTLPSTVDPQVLSGSFSDLPVIQLAATSNESTKTLAANLTKLALPEIKDVDGVNGAQLVGEVGQRVTIIPDPAKLAADGLSTSSITTAINSSGILTPAGSLTQGDKTLTVQAGQQLSSVAQIAALPLVPSTSGASAGGASTGSAGAGAGAGAGADGAGTSASGAGASASGAGASASGASASGSAAAAGGSSAAAGAQAAAAAAASATPTVYTIGDVASVAETDDPITSISRVNGKPALTIAVTKLPSANTVAVSKGVRAIIPDLQAKLGSGTTLTVVFDQAPFIQQSINSLAEEGLLGLFFAVVIILLFLLSVRATLVTAISIPTSVLITFIAMQAFGYTLNIITLGALTIAIGRVVDDSIVVIENIKRQMVPGVDRATTILRAVKEVAGAITASTITTVAVFLPIAFVGDVTGELFRPFALTVTIALLSSLLVALTIVPVLAYWFIRPKVRSAVAAPPAAALSDFDIASAPTAPTAIVSSSAASPAVVPASPSAPTAVPASASAPTVVPASSSASAVVPSPSSAPAVVTAPGEAARASLANRALGLPPTGEAIVGVPAPEPDELEHPSRLQKGYLPIIHWTLRHSALTVILAIVVLAGSVALAPHLKTNYLGSSGQNTLTITQTLEPGTSLEAQDAAAQVVEKQLLATKGVQTVQLSIGSSGSALRDAFTGGGGGITYSVTTDPNADQDALQATIESELKSSKDVGTITVAASGGFGGTSDIEIDITASTQAELQTATDSIVKSVSALSSVKETTSNLSASLPYIAVVVDRHKAAEAGLSEVAVGTIVSQAMQPTQVGSVAINDQTLEIYLQSSNPPKTEAELAALPIPTAKGEVRLDSLATVAQTNGPATITTQKGLRSSAVTATPNTDNLGTANADVSTALKNTELPPGATAVIGGVTSSQSDAFSQLFLALLAAILIVYIVMVATFRSLRQPLELLVSIPFAATGAILLQLISGIPLGVASLIGLLMLVGIVVTNAIVLVDLINQYRRRGRTVEQAVLHGASRRLRPILMTALATIFALLPMAIGLTGGGGFISQPLAIVVIGGLVSSTLLTLVVLPTLYNLIEGRKERRPARRARRDARRAARVARNDRSGGLEGGAGMPADA